LAGIYGEMAGLLGKVQLRKHDKYNIWLSVGGHIEPDEDPNQAAIREVKALEQLSVNKR